ncbi:cytochrome-c peroxidase [Acidobacteria bacterium AH-259-G07]|nr:cytochrome-c peroxidase [Acidobacteria bacterium AH-259-G07]
MNSRNLFINLLIAAILLAAALLAVFAAAKTSVASQRAEIPLGLDLYMSVPEDNPLTRQKVELGRKLFSDPILSRDKSLACAGCHDPERAFTDGRALSVGVFGRKGTRALCPRWSIAVMGAPSSGMAGLPVWKSRCFDPSRIPRRWI